MHRIKEKFSSLIELAQKLESKPRRYGADTMLTGAEIHLLELIGEADKPSVTELAKLFGVTKGAVSQRLKVLEAKGVAAKAPDPANASRAIITLTPKGREAYEAHKQWHETMDGGFKAYLEGLEPDKLAFLDEFITRLEEFTRRLVDGDE